MPQQSTNNSCNIACVTKGQGTYALFVTDDNKYSIEFCEIEEYGMIKFVSSVQIWNDKVNQQLLFHSRHIKFEYQDNESCYYLDKSDIIVLLTPCIHQEYFDVLYVLFDFNRSVFTTINAPDFRLAETDKNLVKLEISFRYSYDDTVKTQILQEEGKVIDLTKLTWYDLNKIDKACVLTTKNNC